MYQLGLDLHSNDLLQKTGLVFYVPMDKQLFFNYMYNAVLFFYSQIQPHLHLVNKIKTKEHN